MIIRYNEEIDDVAAFNQHYINNSPLIRKRKIWMLVLLTVIYGFLFVVNIKSNPGFAIPVGIAYLLFTAWYLTYGHKVSMKRLRQIYSEGKNAGSLCEHTLELLPEGIKETTSVNETITKFAGIDRIAETPSHWLIYIGSNTAYIIPKAKVVEGDAAAFISELKNKL